MRKITFLLSLCLAGIGMTATAQETTDLYPVNFDKDAQLTRTDRATNSVTLSSQAYGSQTLTLENSGHNLWNDHTATTWKVQTGEGLSVSFNYTGSWMHGYVFIDTNGDGFQSSVNNETHAPEQDLYTYSFYSGVETKGTGWDDNGWNSEGINLTGQNRNVLNPPSFTAPTTPGTYRMRLKVDWNSIDPAGDIQTGNHIQDNGGAVIDVMLQVIAPTAPTIAQERTWCIDRSGWSIIAQNYEASGEGTTNGSEDTMIDGNEDTYWHSQWTGDNAGQELPQAFTIDLGSEQEIGGFTYLPRLNNNNGTWTSCKVYVSNNSFGSTASEITIPSEEVTPFMTCTFTHNGNNRVTHAKTAEEAQSGRYVLVVVTGSRGTNGTNVDRYASCAEFNLLKGIAAGKSDAQAQLNVDAVSAYKKYESLKEIADGNDGLPGYMSTEGLSALEANIEAAFDAADGNEGTDVTTANTNLQNALGNVSMAYPANGVYFTITNTNGRGAIIYDPEKSDKVDAQNGNAEYLQGITTADATQKNHLWSFYYNSEFDEYYLYNVGKKQFANLGKGSYSGDTWIFSDTPVAIKFEAMTAPALHLMSGNGTSMSISNGFTGPIITYYAADDGGVPFKFEKSTVEEDQDVTAAIEALVNAYVIKCTKEEAEAALAKTGVGYPTAEAEVRSALQSALESQDEQADATALRAAITAYKSSTTDIQMPEDGKAYTFTNVHPSLGKKYLYISMSDSKLLFADRNDALAEDLPMSAKFICHKLADGRFIFANNTGKYLIWRGSNDGNNSNKGYVDAYDENNCPLTFHKMVTSTLTSSATSNADFFGMMAFGGLRKSGANSHFTSTTSNNNAENFIQDTGWTYRYDTSHSTAFIVEEVAYPNTPNLQAATGNDEVEAIASFSAPFATIVPEGVTAWYAKSYDENEGWITMEKVEGAIPANQGVILTGATGQVTMVPAAEAQATVEDNLLGNSAGADKVLSEANSYILTSVENVVAFYALNTEGDDAARTLGMNKSYLDLSSLAAATSYSVKMSFGGNASGIQAVEKAEDDNAPIYDLSGRRVTVASKGGVYIQNGKKFIVK